MGNYRTPWLTENLLNRSVKAQTDNFNHMLTIKLRFHVQIISRKHRR